MIIIKDNEELKSYIKNGSIVFHESIQCNFDIYVNANIDAININAHNIEAHDIEAININAHDINAHDIKACDINAHNINAHDINAHDIKACDINAHNIEAHDIEASDINALDIEAHDISYYAFCVSYNDIICTSIKGRRNNSFHKCLDGKLTIKEETKKIIIDGKEIELSLESFEALKKSLL